MTVKPCNMLFILSDEHTRDVTGCYGHKVIKTPNLDRLAARGTKFTNAYTNCPICVPARASLQTGRYVGDIGFWDNAFPYDGSVPSWGHRLSAAGHRTMSIGKLHFRSTDARNGFDEEVIPLHVVDGVGDLLGLIRRPKPAALINDRIGLGVVVDYPHAAFPCLQQWQGFGEGLYGFGIEPATSHWGTRADAARNGEIIWLAHGESRAYDTRVAILDGTPAIAAFDARVDAIHPQLADERPLRTRQPVTTAQAPRP